MLLNPARASLSREAAAAPPGLFCSIILGCCYSGLARRQAMGHSSLGISLILGFPQAQGPAAGSQEPRLAPGEGSSVTFVTHGLCRVPLCAIPTPGAASSGPGARSLRAPGLLPCFEGAGERHGRAPVPVFVPGSALGGGTGRNVLETTHPTLSRCEATASSSSSFSSSSCPFF